MPTGPSSDNRLYLLTLLRSLPLPIFLCPTRAVVLHRFPRMQSGKTDRQALRSMTVHESQRVEVLQPASSYGRSDFERGALLGSTDQKIFKLWGDCMPSIAGVATATSANDFFALGGSTAQLWKVLNVMRTKFRPTLMLSDLANNPTLRGMTTVGLSRISVFSLAANPFDWKAETALPMTKASGFGLKELQFEEGIVILLTGGIGLLGREILQHLINAPKVALVHCIAVRSMERTVQHPKIIYHRGYLTKYQFGMSNSNWEQLSHTANLIVHVAALVDHVRPFTSLRTTNVLPKKQLVCLAVPQKIPIHFVSAAAVGRFVGDATFPDMGIAATCHLLMRTATPQANGRVK
jgi:hybrid polyketide synthase/nonribosomal peptide synthetase ACE1